MALQYSVGVRNAKLDAVETTIGTAPILEIRSGAPPADCATADSGTLLASMTLPSDWMAAAASGQKAKSGNCSVAVKPGSSSWFILMCLEPSRRLLSNFCPGKYC